MKKLYLLELSFILISCFIFLALNYWSHSDLLARFSYFILIIGYFSGKWISGFYQKKKLKKDY